MTHWQAGRPGLQQEGPTKTQSVFALTSNSKSLLTNGILSINNINATCTTVFDNFDSLNNFISKNSTISAKSHTNELKN